VVVGDPCILALTSFLSEVLEVGRNCHGSCFCSVDNEHCFNFVSFLITKCAIAWTLTCKWLFHCMHINSSHLIPFRMRLPMICG
jgi:hypothetical protein